MVTVRAVDPDDPDDWTPCDEPMSAQKSYLQALATEAGEDVPDGLSEADASKRDR